MPHITYQSIQNRGIYLLSVRLILKKLDISPQVFNTSSNSPRPRCEDSEKIQSFKNFEYQIKKGRKIE